MTLTQNCAVHTLFWDEHVTKLKLQSMNECRRIICSYYIIFTKSLTKHT